MAGSCISGKEPTGSGGRAGLLGRACTYAHRTQMPPPTEVDAWLDLRVRLWPERSRAELAADRGLVLCDPARNALLAAADDGRQVGSTEVPLRD